MLICHPTEGYPRGVDLDQGLIGPTVQGRSKRPLKRFSVCRSSRCNKGAPPAGFYAPRPNQSLDKVELLNYLMTGSLEYGDGGIAVVNGIKTMRI